MKRRDFLGMALASAGAAACAPNGQRQQPTVFEGFMADCASEMIVAEPELIQRLGFTAEHLGAPPPNTIAPRDAESADLARAASLRRLAQIRAIGRKDLSARETLSYDVLDARLSAIAQGAAFSYGAFAPLSGFSPYVLDHIGAAFLVLPGVVNSHVGTATLANVDEHLRRLRAVARAIDAETARTRADADLGAVAPLCVIDRTRARLEALLTQAPDQSIYVAPLGPRLETIVGPLAQEAGAPEAPEHVRARTAMNQAVGIVANEITGAHRRAWNALGELRARAPAEPGVWRLPNGEAYYRAALALETTTTLTPAEVHQLGLARVRAASAQLDMMLRSQGLAEGAPGARVGLMAVDPRFGYTQADWRAEAVGEVQAQERRVTQIAARWFRTPVGRMDVRGMNALDATAGYAPAAFDGRRTAALTLDLGDPGVTPRFDLGSIAFGDGVPGRHLQSATAMASADVPLLRRMLAFSAYADGWAEYAEQLADEMGLYEGGPTQRLGFLRASARHAALAVVDTGVHYLRWSMDQARAYLVENAGETFANADRLIADVAARPGKAAAGALGRAQIVTLRDNARTALGQAFDIRDFHDQVLHDGQLPLAVLAQKITAWTQRARNSN